MRYLTEEIIKNKAENYYNAFPGWVGVDAGIDTDNNNQRIIKGLCDIIVRIWNEWQYDTRHYRPSRKTYQYYLRAIDRAKGLLDPEAPQYEQAQEVMKDYKVFIDRVMMYRVRSGMGVVM